MEREERNEEAPWLEYISDLTMKLGRTLSKNRDPLKKIRNEDQTAGTGRLDALGGRGGRGVARGSRGRGQGGDAPTTLDCCGLLGRGEEPGQISRRLSALRRKMGSY